MAENEPPPEVVMDAGTVVIVAPSNCTVTALFAANWIPVIVTVVPTSPVIGLSVMAGRGLFEEVTTVKIAVAVSPLRSVPFTVLKPTVAFAGTVIVHPV